MAESAPVDRRKVQHWSSISNIHAHITGSIYRKCFLGLRSVNYGIVHIIYIHIPLCGRDVLELVLLLNASVHKNVCAGGVTQELSCMLKIASN